MKFLFIKEHRSEFSVLKMSQALKVSESGFYSYLNRKPSKRALFRLDLREKIRKAYGLHHGTAGSRTIAADLTAESSMPQRTSETALRQTAAFRACQGRAIAGIMPLRRLSSVL